MATYIASDWAASTAQYDMGDYIGFVEAGHTANFYFRIQPERGNFDGHKYEPLDICGKMGGDL